MNIKKHGFVNVAGFSCSLALALWVHTLSCWADDSVDQARYYQKSMSAALQDYNATLLQLALQASTPEFGEYQLSAFNKIFSPGRSRVETERGDIINIKVASYWGGPYANTDNIIRVCSNQFQGLLGLRALLIRDTDKTKFNAVNNANALNQYKGVLDGNWPDADILEANNIPIRRFIGFENLYRTLSNKRVDYLPLGILEIDSVLEEAQSRYLNLVIANNPFIFYPHPACFYISKKAPRLAKRLEHGLSLIAENGTADQLFNQHFQQAVTNIQNHKRLTFILKNPLLSDDENKEITDNFLMRFGEHIDAITL